MSSVVKRRRRPAEPSNHERWLVSYADFITLLFAFFTTMYAISTVDSKKMTAMMASVQEAFAPRQIQTPIAAGSRELDIGLLPTAGQNINSRVFDQPLRPVVEAHLRDVQNRLTNRLQAAIADGRVDMKLDHRGLVVSVAESGSFDVGSADLSATAQDIFQQVGATLGEIANGVRIEGHTDDVPIHTARFRSNWELSTARATAVVEHLVARSGLDPIRLSASGYGEFHPRAANDTAQSRARNRRVDIVILNPQTRRDEEPSTVPDFVRGVREGGR